MSEGYIVSMSGDALKCETEEQKINWVIMNAMFNWAYDDENYNPYKEAISWAKSQDYFPNLSYEDLFKILKKYESWNEFEQECIENGYEI